MSARFENGNLNAPRPGMRRDAGFVTKPPLYERMSLRGDAFAWCNPVLNTATGNAYKWWSVTTRQIAGSGTTVRDEDEARAAVDRFMEELVHKQLESVAGHSLPNERVAYIDGVLTLTDQSAQWNRYFPHPAIPGREEGSVSHVEAAPTGLERYYLRRFVRRGRMKIEQRPDPDIDTELIMLLVMLDIHANYWGNPMKIYPHTTYRMAADVSNAAFPQTEPAYEPSELQAKDEHHVQLRRSRGLEGDPIKAQPNEEERLFQQEQAHLEARARQRDLPTRYDF